MLNETSKLLFDAEKNNILDVVKIFNGNFSTFADSINDNERLLKDLSDNSVLHGDQIYDLYDKILKLGKKKVGKAGFAIALMAGIAYIVKNECDKADIKNALIAQDKRRAYNYSDLEDEGEATEPIGI